MRACERRNNSLFLVRFCYESQWSGLVWVVSSRRETRLPVHSTHPSGKGIGPRSTATGGAEFEFAVYEELQNGFGDPIVLMD